MHSLDSDKSQSIFRTVDYHYSDSVPYSVRQNILVGNALKFKYFVSGTEWLLTCASVISITVDTHITFTSIPVYVGIFKE